MFNNLVIDRREETDRHTDIFWQRFNHKNVDKPNPTQPMQTTNQLDTE